MRHLVFEGAGRLAFREAPAPALEGPGAALVRPLAVARCDLDAALVHGRAPFRSRALHRLRALWPSPFRRIPCSSATSSMPCPAATAPSS